MGEEQEVLLETGRFRVVRRMQTVRGGDVRSREIIEHPGAVILIPVLDDGRICLIRNYRIAVDETLIELPAGTLDPGESPLETATRELAEETGYRAAKIEQIHEFYMSPGILNERMYLFVATGLTPGETALEPGEQIEPLITPLAEAVEMTLDGRIHDAKTIASLLVYDRHRSG